MKRLITAVAIVVSLVGCVRPYNTAVLPDEPLDIAILPPSSGFGFWVNQPAHVAMFDITPGLGVRMLYPHLSKQLTELVNAGSSYAYPTMSFRPRDYFVGRQLNQPHVLLAVASRLPFNIRQTVGYSDWLTYKLGMSAFAGTSLEVINQVYDQIIPPQPDGDWATAVYLVYPDLPWRDNIYRLVRCPDGLIYVVNIETPAFYCPAPEQVPEQKSVDPDRERRPPPTVKTAPSIARASRNGELPILRASGDVVTRPPSPVASRVFRGSRESDSPTFGYSRREYVAPSSQTATPVPVVSRPVVEQPPAQQQGSDPRGEPSRRENPAKEP